MAFQISFAGSLGVELARITNEQLDFALRCLEQIAGSTPNSNVEVAIHEFRKSTKKLRSVFRMVRSALPEGVYTSWIAILRSASAELSASRDATVLEQHLREAYLAICPGADWGDKPWRNLDLFAPYRDQAVASRSAAQVGHVRAELLTLKAQVADFGFEQVGISHLLEGHRRSFKQARQLLALLRAPFPEPTMHKFRKRTKDTFYQVRLLARLYPRKLQKEQSRFEQLSETLGLLHDLLVLRSAIENARTTTSQVKELPGLLDYVLGRIARLERRTLRIASKLYKDVPKRRTRRLADCYYATLRAQHRRAMEKAAAPDPLPRLAKVVRLPAVSLKKCDAQARAANPKRRSNSMIRLAAHATHSTVSARMSP